MGLNPIVNLSSGSVPNDPQFWLDAAHQAVRTYCEWHVAPSIQETLTLDGSGTSKLLLPSKRVQAVASVIDNGDDITANVDFSEDGILTYGAGFTSRPRGVTVILTHGWNADEASDVLGLIAKLAGRAAASAGNIAAQSAGTQSVTYVRASDGLPPGVGLLKTEKADLARYKLNWGI